MAGEPTGETSDTLKSNGPEPMEEDVAQTPPTAAASTDTTTAAANRADPLPTNENVVTIMQRYHELRDKELNNGFLTIEDYIELFLIEIVQNLDTARQTLTRAKQRYNNESLFVSINGFLCFNYADDFTNGIKRIRAVSNRLTKFNHYLEEISNRFLAYGIASVVKCYSSIKIEALANMLCLSESEVKNFLNTAHWPIENSIVKVEDTEAVQTAVKSLISPLYGSFQCMNKFAGYTVSEQPKDKPIDSLKKLVMISDQLSKISAPPSVVKSTSGDHENIEDKSPTSAPVVNGL